jgi:hypothetical protein
VKDALESALRPNATTTRLGAVALASGIIASPQHKNFRFQPTTCGMWVKLIGILLLAVWAFVMAVLMWRNAGPES